MKVSGSYSAVGADLFCSSGNMWVKTTPCTMMRDNTAALSGLFHTFYIGSLDLCTAKEREVNPYLEARPLWELVLPLYFLFCILNISCAHQDYPSGLNLAACERKHLPLRSARCEHTSYSCTQAVGGKSAAEVMGHVVLFWLTHCCTSVCRGQCCRGLGGVFFFNGNVQIWANSCRWQVFSLVLRCNIWSDVHVFFFFSQ